MSIEEGKIELSLKNPLSSERIFVKNLDEYIKDENNILIYLDDDQMPYCMKRSYFINLLIEDYDYECIDLKPIITHSREYYNLSKLFLNVEGQPKIIIKMSDITVFFDPSITHFKLTRKTPPKNIYTCTNVDIQKHAYDESVYRDGKYPYEEEKWSALANYCSSGFRPINNYLVRLTEYEKYSLSDLVKDIVFWIKGEKKLPEPIKENKRIQDEINDIDHLFYKYAEKSDKPFVVYRGMSKFYTYLKKPGDKMVIENFMSCFDEGGGLIGSWSVYCKITVEPGIPYIKTYTNKEFRPYLLHPEEKEVVLPRNLVATYEGENELGEKLIRVTPLYPGQFSEELVCNEMTLYKIEKGEGISDKGILEWKEINGGSRKKNKKYFKKSMRKRSKRKNKTYKKYSYKNNKNYFKTN